MKPTLSPAALALAIGLALGTLGAPTIAMAQSKRAAEPVTLSFVGAEIEAVARTIATITGRNVVVDPRVKGTINLSTDKPVAPMVALNQFAAALRLQGFSLVETGGLYKIVPEADAKLQSKHGQRRAGREAARQQPDRHPDLPPQPRVGQQSRAGAAAADRPQQHDQRQPWQQLAGHHRLQRQPAAHRSHHCRARRGWRHRCRDHSVAARRGGRPRTRGAEADRIQRAVLQARPPGRQAMPPTGPPCWPSPAATA